MKQSAMSRPASRNGVVLYDGDCSFCTRWLKFWTPELERNGYAVDTLQAPWVGAALPMPQHELLTDIRLLRPDDSVVSGADAYLFVMRRIWWAVPLWALCSLPGLNALFRAGYREFARNRYCISGRCRL